MRDALRALWQEDREPVILDTGGSTGPWIQRIVKELSVTPMFAFD
jgi:hypothetical protein